MKSMYVVAFETMSGMERMQFECLRDAMWHYHTLRKHLRRPSLYKI